MKNAVVLMTALVPTEGHADLIRFASALPSTTVWVLINGRSWEPYGGARRLAAISQTFAAAPNVRVRLAEQDDAPQNPPDHPHFWDWWRDAINGAFPEVDRWDYVVASEPYGAQVAEALAARFMPYDVARSLNAARGATVREDLWTNWTQALRPVRTDLQMRGVLFGQESVGKTTVSKLVAEELSCDWLFEYARPYQDQIGPHINEQTMSEIHAGQYALQLNAFSAARTPALVLDTDLFSTVGYYPLMGLTPPPQLVRDAHELKSQVYYLMDDGVPFEPDQFRYGGDRRESSKHYWQDLLETHSLPHVLVPLGSAQEEAAFIASDLKRRFQENVLPIKSFARD